MFARLQRLILYLAIIDLLGTEAALYLADWARRLLPLGQPLGQPTALVSPALYLVVAIVYPVAFVALSVYDLRRDTRPVGDPGSLTRAVIVGAFVFAGVLYFTFRDVPRLLVVYFFVAQLALLAGVRLLIGTGLRLLVRRG